MRRWPLVVLLASIGLTALAAIEAQRAVRSHERIADRALSEYANFAAWAYAQRVEDTLRLIEREAMGAVNHGDNLHTAAQVPRAAELAHYLPWNAQCMCHRPSIGPVPEAFFAIKVGDKTLDAGLNTHDMAMDGWEVDRPMPVMMHGAPERYFSDEEARWIVDSLTRRVRRLGEVDHGYTLVVGDVGGAPHILTYTLMPTSWGDTLVYGARYSRAALVGILQGVLDGRGLLPATFTSGRRNRDILAVRVRDHAGTVLYESAPVTTSPLESNVTLAPRAGLLSVDAVIRPELAGALVIGGLPRSRLPFLLGLLAVAAALSIVAGVQLRREGELARLQSGFVSSVSHELRTPLAQIRLYLETLQLGRATTDEQRRWSLQHIERETTRLTHLVENVLRFSTLGAADPTTREPADVAAEVASIVDEFRPLAESRRAKIRVDATPVPALALKADALRHIVLNLLDNAVKYGPMDQTISVGVRERLGTVTISVDDEGPGVADAERERIWRPFARGDAAAHNGGSGIGLSIVREVAEAHGGHARVERAPG
ncbi:MAG: sensor histidine kinase, partial [Gemmatimonadaceae bacterium]